MWERRAVSSCSNGTCVVSALWSVIDLYREGGFGDLVPGPSKTQDDPDLLNDATDDLPQGK